MTLHTDDFAGTDGQLLDARPGWTRNGTVNGIAEIRNNRLATVATTGDNAAYDAPDTGSADHYAQAAFHSNAQANSFGVVCRMQDRQNWGIGIRLNSASQMQVSRRNASTVVNITTVSITHTAGDVYRIEVEGTSARIYQNGSLLTTVTASTFTTETKTGVVVRINTHNPWIDDWESGPLAAPAVDLSGTGAQGANTGAGTLSPLVDLSGTGAQGAHTGAGTLSPLVDLSGNATQAGDTGAGTLEPAAAGVDLSGGATQGANTGSGTLAPIVDLAGTGAGAGDTGDGTLEVLGGPLELSGGATQGPDTGAGTLDVVVALSGTGAQEPHVGAGGLSDGSEPVEEPRRRRGGSITYDKRNRWRVEEPKQEPPEPEAPQPVAERAPVVPGGPVAAKPGEVATIRDWLTPDAIAAAQRAAEAEEEDELEMLLGML